MSQIPETKPISSNDNEQAASVVTERKHTTVGKSLKISLKVFVVLLVFCLGFILGGLRGTAYRQQTDEQIDNRLDDFNQLVYLYDTKQKLENYYETMERVRSEEFGYPPGSHGAKMLSDLLRVERPLVEVGHFTVFFENYFENDNPKFSVRDTQSRKDIVTLRGGNMQPKVLTFSSIIAEDRTWVETILHYSQDGFYERCFFTFHGKERWGGRRYLDTKGSGVFDEMSFSEDTAPFSENCGLVKYHLDGLTWVREEVSEFQPRKNNINPYLNPLTGLPFGINPYDNQNSTEN